jgi:hypothetical protein
MDRNTLWRLGTALPLVLSRGALDLTFGTGGIVTTAPTGPSTAASANAVLVQPDRSIVVVGYD